MHKEENSCDILLWRGRRENGTLRRIRTTAVDEPEGPLVNINMIPGIRYQYKYIIRTGTRYYSVLDSSL